MQTISRWRHGSNFRIQFFVDKRNPRCRILLEQLTGLQLVKKFPAFHGTRRFITALTSFRHLSLSWASPIQSIYPHPTSWRSVLILSTHLRLGLPSGLFPSGLPTKTLYLITPWRRIFLKKLTGLQLVKKFPAFHRTQMFIIAIIYDLIFGNQLFREPPGGLKVRTDCSLVFVRIPQLNLTHDSPRWTNISLLHTLCNSQLSYRSKEIYNHVRHARFW